uniref:Interleukin-2 receptor subunit alpha n=1 Tax=Rhinolophus ferrumequinum TaxID=59479 RepID=A0A671FP07_RHIFE
MEPSLLMWRFFTLFLVTDCLEEFCISKPPKLRHATFKALTYKMGTLVNCECKKGFRRMKRGSLFLQCMGNSSHSSWKNQCQCKSTSSTDKGKQVTPKPEEQKERNTTDMQSQMQPTDQVPFLGDQEPQASMDTPSGSETSCPLTTTDFQKHTEVATTMEPVIFTIEYQMTVAFCVLLLISVLLLSGLSWQRRWRKSRRTI